MSSWLMVTLWLSSRVSIALLLRNTHCSSQGGNIADYRQPGGQKSMGMYQSCKEWGHTTWLQGLSLGDKKCSICLCVHPTAPGPAITQLCLASEEGKCLGATRVPCPQALNLPCTLIPCSQHPSSQDAHPLSLVGRLLYCALNKSIPWLPPPGFPGVHVIPAMASFKGDVITSLTCHNTEIPLPNAHFSSHWQSRWLHLQYHPLPQHQLSPSAGTSHLQLPWQSPSL